MKQKRFFRAIVAIAMMLICSLPSLAYDFEIDGIYYNITSSSEPYTVEVTCDDENLNSYSGTILIPESVTYNEKKYLVTKIGDWTFFQCGENLTRVEIPNSIIEIGDWAFSGCQAMMTSIPESVTTIGEYAFSFSGLMLINTQIPNSIISIGNNAFEECFIEMDLLKLPTSLQSLGENVFIGNGGSPNQSKLCISEAITPPTITTTSLPSTIKTLIVPSGSKSVYESADVWSDLIADNNITVIEKGFLSITVENTTAGQLNRAVRTASGAKAALVTDMVVTGTINATDIEYMRQSMTSLLNLDLSGADCVEFPDGAFANKITLQSINLPNNLNSVNNTLFTYCIALSSLSLNTETIGEKTFYNLPSLSDVDLGENVKTVENNAFSGCVSLKEITIPDATLSLGESAFSGCQSLKSVTLGNALTSIGQYAFSSCGSLAQLSIPETVVSIGDYAFSNCPNLSDINIPENIETIGTYTFEGCTSLSEIELPESIETIPAGMFENCSSLSSVDIPIGVTEIGENAFSGCEKLTILDLSENTSLLSIGGNAFYGCSSIEIINFPTTLESIGRNAFSGCTALSLMSIPSVTPPSLPSTLADFSFNNVDNILCAISIPTDSFWDYYDTNSWTRFMDGDETAGKEQIDITVENPATESGDGSDSTDDTAYGDCCHIHYHKGHTGPKQIRAVMRANEETQAVNSAKTYGGSSVFIAENESVSFVITPAEGYKVESVYYDTDADGVEEDVTSQFVDNVYTTPAAESLVVKSLRIKLAEDIPTSVEKVNDSITNNVKVIGNTIQVPEGAVIFNIDGLKVDGNNLSSGIYIVSYRNQRMKVLVK